MVSLLLIFGACKNSRNTKEETNNEKNMTDTEVAQIAYKHYGGMAGLSTTLSITDGSTCYSYSLHIDKESARRCDMPTTDAIWQKLLSELDLSTFQKIKSGGSLLPVDGTDREFTIILTSGEEYSFINGEDDKHFKKLQPFFDQLTTILDECHNNSLPKNT